MIGLVDPDSVGSGTELVAQVEEIFSPTGPFSRSKNFEYRPQQQQMAVAVAPRHNRTINHLAAAYRRTGRPGDARAMYEQALVNNRYEVPAAMGLSELDIQEGTESSLAAAERRLLRLLDWMPENVVAWTNLGVARVALGRTGEAIEAYAEALRRNPNHVTAAVNLAQLYHLAGDTQRARSLFDRRHRRWPA